MISKEDKEWMSKFMSEYWNFVKEFGDLTLDDDKADRMVSAANVLVEKYNSDKRVLCMVTGYINGLEREVRSRF